MSLLGRNAVRAVVRSSQRARFATNSDYVTQYTHVKQHAVGES